MHYLADYGLFLAKTLTWVIAILILVAGVLSLALKNKMAKTQKQLQIQKLNQQYLSYHERMHEAVLPKKAYKNWYKTLQQEEKNKEKSSAAKPRIFVLSFQGDIRASAVIHLREEITAVLSVATPQDEVVVCLESAGGMVQNYGLAASQLQRIRQKNIPLTVIIDKIAASGGYLMACVANKILAAPFAIIGSIGVVAQIPNFHRWLQKHTIDVEQITAGQYKRTLTLLGENTPEKREKMQQELEEIHFYFKAFIHENRPQVILEQVATGEHWLASKALTLQLIDGLTTSDDYLWQQRDHAEIFTVRYCGKPSLKEKLSLWMENNSQSFLNKFYFLKR